jgi:argininosuccinate lyase
MKLWEKNAELNKEIEKFTVGDDYLLDHKLVKFDCLSSIAHAKMLHQIKILNEEELNKLIEGLKEIIKLDSQGKFKIKAEDEDCHTAIEFYLTEKFGDVGKKIHACRSRNDQVLTALRLFEKVELNEIKVLVTKMIKVLGKLIAEAGEIIIPGYTHMQKAMPLKIKVWLNCFVDSAEDNLKQLEFVLKLIDQSPLGSAASFGVPVFDIDKKMTAELMGFSKVMENPVYCQMSRGKFESTIIHLLTQIMFDLNKLSSDLILFNMDEFGFISLPKEFCTGSSIMPQKSNPDVLELIRAKYHLVLGEEFKVKSMMGNLISGYNKDLQLTKEPLFNSIKITKECLKMVCLVLDGIKVNEEKCKKAITPELFATEKAYKLVKEGLPFREAYKEIAKNYNY